MRKTIMSKKTITLPAIEIQQDGTRLLITKMKASELPIFTKIDHFDTDKPFDHPEQGYQRPEEKPRVRKFGNWLRRESDEGKKVRVPSAILLSGRNTGIVLSPNGTITLNSADKLSMIDGQHRAAGFRYAIEEKGLDKFTDYELPVVIVLDVNKIEEMIQFRVVNGEQKSVRTDLVNMILTQVVEHSGDEAIPDSDAWKVVTSRVVKRLNDDEDGSWDDKIVMPDQSSYTRDELADNPDLRHLRIARATSFIQSLKPIESYLMGTLPAPPGGKPSIDDRTELLFDVINNYWGAIRNLNPECFEAADDYVLQKTPGIFSLHMLLPSLLKSMVIGKRDWVEDQFEEMLLDCPEISQPQFWHVGDAETKMARGEAASYGSMKGFAELSARLHEILVST